MILPTDMKIVQAVILFLIGQALYTESVDGQKDGFPGTVHLDGTPIHGAEEGSPTRLPGLVPGVEGVVRSRRSPNTLHRSRNRAYDAITPDCIPGSLYRTPDGNFYKICPEPKLEKLNDGLSTRFLGNNFGGNGEALGRGQGQIEEGYEGKNQFGLGGEGEIGNRGNGFDLGKLLGFAFEGILKGNVKLTGSSSHKWQGFLKGNGTFDGKGKHGGEARLGPMNTNPDNSNQMIGFDIDGGEVGSGTGSGQRNKNATNDPIGQVHRGGEPEEADSFTPGNGTGKGKIPIQETDFGKPSLSASITPQENGSFIEIDKLQGSGNYQGGDNHKDCPEVRISLENSEEKGSLSGRSSAEGSDISKIIGILQWGGNNQGTGNNNDGDFKRVYKKGTCDIYLISTQSGSNQDVKRYPNGPRPPVKEILVRPQHGGGGKDGRYVEILPEQLHGFAAGDPRNMKYNIEDPDPNYPDFSPEKVSESDEMQYGDEDLIQFPQP